MLTNHLALIPFFTYPTFLYYFIADILSPFQTYISVCLQHICYYPSYLRSLAILHFLSGCPYFLKGSLTASNVLRVSVFQGNSSFDILSQYMLSKLLLIFHLQLQFSSFTICIATLNTVPCPSYSSSITLNVCLIYYCPFDFSSLLHI